MAYLVIKSNVNVNIYVVKMNKYCSPWISEFFFSQLNKGLLNGFPCRIA